MNASTRHFARHYLELLVAMFVGMAVLGLPVGLGLSALGMSSSELQTRHLRCCCSSWRSP